MGRKKRKRKQKGRGLLNEILKTAASQKRRRKRKRQRGKGFFTDLLKTGAKQALTAVAKTGLDVLENKRSIKDAKNTAGMAKQRFSPS